MDMPAHLWPYGGGGPPAPSQVKSACFGKCMTSPTDSINFMWHGLVEINDQQKESLCHLRCKLRNHSGARSWKRNKKKLHWSVWQNNKSAHVQTTTAPSTHTQSDTSTNIHMYRNTQTPQQTQSAKCSDVCSQPLPHLCVA